MAAGLNKELVDLGDIDELVRHVDRLCAAADWHGLVELHDLCRAALERGKQLWPVAAHAEYRLALEAPGRMAARTLVPGAGRFALGPLTEVAASTHTWPELAEHAPQGPTASVAAHERVLRGDDLTGDSRIERVLDLPLVMQEWEPSYPLAEYKAHAATFPFPPLPPLVPVDLRGQKVDGAEDAGEAAALLDLASVWTAESNGRAEAHSVRGDALCAVAAFGIEEARIATVDPATALALMAWTAASGGAHGRRKGMAAGRFAAWWTAATLAAVVEEWPPDPEELGAAIGELRWFVWDAGFPDTGWACRLAVEDPDNGVAWAFSARDAVL